ncbi:MAG TPA: ABC transporter ATP-binding protein [Conexibacter sp.]|nr:ABC transporter ATP-binding protein [Conexibacter sp.]
MLHVQGLRKHYGGIEALRGLDLHVEAGELVCLIGANGAGKTTLLRSLSGLVPCSGGGAEFLGTRITGCSAESIARAGLVHVPEGRRVFPRLTCRENLLVGAWGRRDRVKQDVERIERLFPILAERHKQPAYSLSGGEQQMLALGRGLMRQPKLLMLDEPSLGLAPLAVRAVFEMIAEIRASGTTVLLVEQNASMALSIADRAYVLERGSVQAEGAASALRDDDAVRRAYLGHTG